MTAFVFRCDLSPRIGGGHIRRCAVLASELKGRGARVVFACRAEDADPSPELEGAADELVRVGAAISAEEDARLVSRLARGCGARAAVIDRYGADPGFGRALARAGVRWLQFDWEGREPILADWILNPSPAAEEAVYRRLAGKRGARLLLGPSYALLRPGFCAGAGRGRVRARVEAVLVTLGGGDDRGGTETCLAALRLLDPRPACTVLVGGFNPRRALIEEGGSGYAAVVAGERDVAGRMAEADIAVIGGGTTTFEAAAMGLPSVIVRLADNQAPNAAAWARRGVALDAGPVERLTAERLAALVRRLARDGTLRGAMAAAGAALVDCRGAKRVADALGEREG